MIFCIFLSNYPSIYLYIASALSLPNFMAVYPSASLDMKLGLPLYVIPFTPLGSLLAYNNVTDRGIRPMVFSSLEMDLGPKFRSEEPQSLKKVCIWTWILTQLLISILNTIINCIHFHQANQLHFQPSSNSKTFVSGSIVDIVHGRQSFKTVINVHKCITR